MTRPYQRYTKEELARVVSECFSLAEVARRFGKSPVGGTCNNIRFMCQKWEIDCSHMTGQGHMKNKISRKRIPADDILVLGTKFDRRTKADRLRRALIEIGVPYVCNDCGMEPMWNNKPITLEVDHIDECYWNNVRTNLQFLCPNCHTQKTLGTDGTTA